MKFNSLRSFFKRYSRILWVVIAVLISLLIFVFRDLVSDLEGFGLFGLFVISIIGNATIILPTPVILTAFIGGAVFNPLMVAIVVSLGATIGELTGYMAGYGGGEIIEEKVKIEKVKRWMDKYGLWTLFVLAAIPNPLFDVAGIISGAIGIPVYKYLIVVWLGKFVKFAVFSFLGAGSASFIDGLK
jgi:uncharacterized membrane protein YdjX (TVP38/TMEM64 family)